MDIKIFERCCYGFETGDVKLGGSGAWNYDIIEILNHELMHKYLHELINKQVSSEYHNVNSDFGLELWLYHEDKYNKIMEERLKFIESCKDLEAVTNDD
jgi:hypothetical protein